MTNDLPKTKRQLFALLRKTTDKDERSRICEAIGAINSATCDAEVVPKSAFQKRMDHIARENEREERSARYYDRKMMGR